MTQPPPYGVPPQPGVPQGYPQQPAPPPAYLGGGGQPYPPQPPAGPAGPAGYGVPGVPAGPGLPPPPPSAKRTIGFTMGLLTALVLIGFVVAVALITAGS
ncbi:hypothetical protein F9L07_12085 [Pimelobacter simplex]|uniref:Uncharacterized protein n=1 Tax=Nocardioides simplex TaxID=2045 RepID=A0A7J5E2M3_NOCSI|nr:hypothetical protein [Pimelobacter simplex]KAB2812496.1 hypothetical protein F9L07_12085 [Pimelobacter simplex]